MASASYNDFVLALPSWRDIYTTDGDRRMTFEQAYAFNRTVLEIYAELDYSVVVVPRATIGERVKFVLETLELG